MLVEVLRAVAEVDAEHLRGRARPVKRALDVRLGQLRAEQDAQRAGGAVALGDDPLGVEVIDVAAPVLHAEVTHLRALAGVDLHRAVGEALALAGRRDELVDEDDLGALLGDDQRVREDGRGVGVGVDARL